MENFSIKLSKDGDFSAVYIIVDGKEYPLIQSVELKGKYTIEYPAIVTTIEQG